MLLAHRVVCAAHVEEHTSILQHRGCGVVGEVGFNGLGKPFWRRSLGAGGHALLYQPMRARRLVMCAV